MKPRIRSSVGVVINGNTVEFFKGNTRRSTVIKLSPNVSKILCELDGRRTMDDIFSFYNLNEDSQKGFEKLIDYLVYKCIVYDQEKRIESGDRKIYSRIFSMLEDYSCDENVIQQSWKKITESKVCIVGLGAVGSWIAANLVQSGVKNLILIDKDKVEISNLHRQWGYSLEDIGQKKADVLAKRLLQMNENLCIQTVYEFIDENALEKMAISDIDLMIDSADKPTVDQTAVWVGEYCMKRNIPHIIAGGYNLHVSLIGQTVIPHKTACVKCFERQLKAHNELELSNMKKLATEGRKIGSIGPMCSLSASFASLDAIKVLSGIIEPTNINRRGEFNIYNMDIQYHNYNKLDDCEWCGKDGKYKE